MPETKAGPEANDEFGVSKTPSWVSRLRDAARGAGRPRTPEAEILTLAAAVAPGKTWESAEPAAIVQAEPVEEAKTERTDEQPSATAPEEVTPISACETEPPRRTVKTAARYVICRIGAKRLALAVEQVLEVRPVPRCAVIPGMAGFVRGLANVRGEAAYVLDLGELLGIESDADGASERILVVKTPGEDQRVGLAVDAVLDFALLAGPEVADDDEGGELAGFLCEVCEFEGQEVRVLDIEGVLGSGIIGEFAQLPAARPQEAR